MTGFTLALLATALAGSAPASTTAPASDPGKKICVKEPRVGTRFVRTRCLTETQWREMRREGRELTHWLQQVGDIAGGR